MRYFQRNENFISQFPILPILNLLDLARLDPFLDVAVGGWCRDAEGGGKMQIRLAVKGLRGCVEEGLLACVCRWGRYGCNKQKFFGHFSVQNQHILYEMRFAVISYSIVGVCKTDFEGYPELRIFALMGFNGDGKRNCSRVYLLEKGTLMDKGQKQQRI